MRIFDIIMILVKVYLSLKIEMDLEFLSGWGWKGG